MSHEMEFKLLQPWSTFVMKTKLPPSILEKMIRITDEIVENRAGRGDDVGAGEMKDQFWIDIDFEILEQEELVGVFLDVCRTYVVQAFCQSQPFKEEEWLKEEWLTRLTHIWVNSQKDNEYFPMHVHSKCALSSVMYLKIPEYLPCRKIGDGIGKDGAIEFSNNSSQEKIWGVPTLSIYPQVGDFFIFPATQLHQAYPFRTLDGEGERRSVSFNAEFTSKSEQDNLKKQQKKH